MRFTSAGCRRIRPYTAAAWPSCFLPRRRMAPGTSRAARPSSNPISRAASLTATTSGFRNGGPAGPPSRWHMLCRSRGRRCRACHGRRRSASPSCPDFSGKRDCLTLARVEILKPEAALRGSDFRPRGRVSGPVLDQFRRNRVHQFRQDGRWDQNAPIELTEEFDLPDQHEVVDRRRIGNDNDRTQRRASLSLASRSVSRSCSKSAAVKSYTSCAFKNASTCMRVAKPSSLRSCAALRAWERYASSARLSSAARGRSFHVALSSCTISSGNSNVIRMAAPSTHYPNDCASQQSRRHGRLSQRDPAVIRRDARVQVYLEPVLPQRGGKLLRQPHVLKRPAAQAHARDPGLLAQQPADLFRRVRDRVVEPRRDGSA